MSRATLPEATQAIMAVAGEERSPLRLLLGRDAVRLARQIDQADLAEISRWEQPSTSTDFAGGALPPESESGLQDILNPM